MLVSYLEARTVSFIKIEVCFGSDMGLASQKNAVDLQGISKAYNDNLKTSSFFFYWEF